MGTTKSNETYSAVSLSGGKDSSCLLILMIEKGLPIDCVLYADTGMEFPEMVEHLAKLDAFLFRERGLHITTLRHPHGFEWLMFDVPQQQKRAIERRIAMGQPPTGYGWPGMRVRWCTGQLKTHLITKEVNRLKKEKNALHHIGIAADEAHRCKDDPHNRYPLVEWGITEAQALQICYDRGYDWGDLIVTPSNREQLNEFVEIMLEVALSRTPTMKIGRDAEYPTAFVRQRFEQITSAHIEKVLDGIQENTTRVWNTRAYLLAALFNAPSTMDNHYTMLVNHDLNGGN